MRTPYISIAVCALLFAAAPLAFAQDEKTEEQRVKPDQTSVAPLRSTEERPPVKAAPAQGEVRAKTEKAKTEAARTVKAREAAAQNQVRTEAREAELSSAKAKREEQKAERERELIKKRNERIAAYFEKMTDRLEAAVKRLEGLSERVSARIEKFEERKIDVSASKDLYAKALTEIEAARASLTAAREKFKALEGSSEPKTAFEETRALVKTTVEQIKKAHKALVDTIVSLKANVKTTEGETSAETNE